MGVLSEVSLKVQAIPETAACVLLDGLDDTAAVAAMSKALGSPYDITGAAHAPVGVDGHPVTMIRIEGLEASVSYRAEKLTALFADSGASIRVERDSSKVADGWAWVRDVALMQGGANPVWRLSVKPSDAPGIVAGLREGHPDIKVLYDWGGGLLWIEAPEGVDLRAGGIAGHASEALTTVA